MIDRRSLLLGLAAAWQARGDTHPIGWDGHAPYGLLKSPVAGKCFKPHATNVKPRPTVSCLDESSRRKLYDDLYKGYDELLRRAPGPTTYTSLQSVDPTSLLYQGNLHGYYCDTGGIHNNWAFLPWHRAFIYFHERILQSIVGDDFRLPVWEWDLCGNVPPFYPDWAKTRLLIRYGLTTATGLFGHGQLQAWIQSSTPDDFLGTATNEPNAVGGPHSLIHGNFGYLMGAPRTAALDPLFYTHHANVDRFWEFWRRSYRFPDDANWLKQSFGFHDRDGQAVSIAVPDLLDLDALGYCYPSWPDRNLIHPFKTVTQSGFDPDSMIVRFSPLDFEEILKQHVSITSYLDAIVAALTNPQRIILPCRVFGTLSAEAGKVYLVGLRSVKDTSNASTARIIGDFAVFMSHKMDNMKIMATCSLSIEDIKFLAENNFETRFVWGPADASGRSILAGQQQTFWPISKVEFLFPFPGASTPH